MIPMNRPAADGMGKPVDVDFLRQWIGREDILDEVLSETLVHRFRVTLGLSGLPGVPDAIAPRMIHFCLCQPCDPIADLGADGHSRRGRFLPPVPLERRMWAGSEFRFSGDFRVGDHVRRQSRVADVVIKSGKNGELCFVQVDHSYSVDGKVIVEEHQNLVYMESLPATAPAGEPAPQGKHQRLLDTSPVTLFRYSALTFNGYRIHYDAPFAVNVEGFAGLVVHAPLQATMLYHLAAELGRSPPDRFAFRSASTLCDRDSVTLHADVREAGSLHLWSARTGGPIAVDATANWQDPQP